MCRLHHGHNKHDNAKSGRSGGASAKKSARRQTAPQLSRLQSRQQLTYSLRYQNRRRIARTKVRAFIRGPLSGLQAQIQGPRNKATYTAKTVGCLCLSLFKGQPQTTDQLPSRVRTLQHFTVSICSYCPFFPIHSKRLLSCE